MQRNDSIDIAKGIAIILMIIGHCPHLPYVIVNPIFSFHMPLFFIFSGYFYKQKPMKQLVLSEIKHLVKPYIITCIVTLILCLTAQRYDLLQEKAIGMLLGNGGGRMFGEMQPVIGPVWFLLALFWCKIFYAILRTKTEHYFVMSFVISTIAFVLGKYVGILPLGMLYGLCALVFYAMGDYWRNEYGKDKLSTEVFVIGIAVWLFCIVVSHLEIANYECRHYPITMAGAFMGTYITYLISQRMPRLFRPTLQWAGQNSLLILCYHQIATYILRNLEQYILFPHNIPYTKLGYFALNLVVAIGFTYIHTLIAKSIKNNN